MSSRPGHPAAPPLSESDPRARARQVAIIDIGARAIRLDIAEIHPDGRMRLLESLQRAAGLGKDTFAEGSIDRDSIEECVAILKGFKQTMTEYGVSSPDQVRAVATSSVREAANRDTFLDRIYIATGIAVDVLEDAEVEHLIHLAIHDLFDADPALNHGHVLAVEAGGGTTRLLLIQDGYVTYSGAFKLGTLRMMETLESYQTPSDRLGALFDQHIHRTVNQMTETVPARRVSTVIALAGDTETAFRRLLPGWGSGDLVRARMAHFNLAEKIVATPADKLMRKYRIPSQEAESAGQALLIYDRIARAFGARDLMVTTKSMRRGLLLGMAGVPSGATRFAEQLAHSAVSLGRKYRFDERHSLHVADLSLRLFDELQADHGLGPHPKALLRTAAILHDIGAFVSNSAHHKHSMYLVLNSEIFGLTKHDNLIVALLARYHRRAEPRPTHPEYAALDRDSRLVVAKLAAILRVADALDRGHLQRVQNLQFSREGARFAIVVDDVEDVTLERLAMKDKSSLFEDVFGMTVVLRAGQGSKG